MAYWRPVLHGELAEAASEAIRAIAASIGEAGREPPEGLGRSYPHSLGFGRAGVGLFYAYLASCTDNNLASESAREHLEAALRGLAEDAMPPDLYRGFSGIVWTLQHLRESLWEEVVEDPIVAADDALAAWIETGSTPTELMHGLAGACIYGLERLSSPSGRRVAELAVAALAERCLRPGGVGWPLSGTEARHLESSYSRDRPPGWKAKVADLRRLASTGRLVRPGAAHGAAGVAVALGAAYACGVETERAARVLGELIPWLLAQRRLEGYGSAFPEFCDTNHHQTQTGWCNGDLGIITSLFLVARCLGEEDWEREVLETARREADRRPEDVERFNRGNPIVCHGTAGWAHLFNRLYQATGEERFATSARRWLEATLALHCDTVNEPSAAGYGGFAASEDGVLYPLRGFLMGSAGIGLVLLAATSDGEPAWDCVLGTSVPGLGIPP